MIASFMTLDLKKLASILKLSPATVLRAMGNFPDVSIKTKEKVREVVKIHAYNPKSVARRLKKGQTVTIGIVLTAEENYFQDTLFLHRF